MKLADLPTKTFEENCASRCKEYSNHSKSFYHLSRYHREYGNFKAAINCQQIAASAAGTAMYYRFAVIDGRSPDIAE